MIRCRRDIPSVFGLINVAFRRLVECAIFDQHDLIAVVIEDNFVHEGANQEQSPATELC